MTKQNDRIVAELLISKYDNEQLEKENKALKDELKIAMVKGTGGSAGQEYIDPTKGKTFVPAPGKSKNKKETYEQLKFPIEGAKRFSNPGLSIAQQYRMMGDGVTDFWDTHPLDRYEPKRPSKYDPRIQELRNILAPIVNKQASISDSYQRENVGGTLRDVMLPLLIKNYGKGPDGKYKDPDKLIEMMGKLKGV